MGEWLYLLMRIAVLEEFMETFRRILLIGLVAMLSGTGLAWAQASATLTITAPAEAKQGETVKITVLLADPSGAPLAGESVAVYEVVRLFSYTDKVLLGEVTTDFQGKASLSHIPRQEGDGRLVAEFSGRDGLAAASAGTVLAVGAGAMPPTLVDPPPILPRGVNAVWVLGVLVAVWLAFGAALYHTARIPMERAGFVNRGN
jgi:hypothetical protein